MKPVRERCPECGRIVEGIEQTESPLRYVSQVLCCSLGHSWNCLLLIPITLTFQQ